VTAGESQTVPVIRDRDVYASFLANPSSATNPGVSGPTHRIPAVHQAQHRPASTTVVPVTTTSSVLVTPHSHSHNHSQYLYPHTPDLTISSSHHAPAPMTAPPGHVLHATGLSQSTRASQPLIPIPGPIPATANPAPAHRNRASHQIVPIVPGNSQPINIALHTAQYSNPGRPKVFFGNYQLLHTLGEGEFGKVKLGVHAQRCVRVYT